MIFILFSVWQQSASPQIASREQASEISSELVTGDALVMHTADHLKLIWTQSRYNWIRAIRADAGLFVQSCWLSLLMLTTPAFCCCCQEQTHDFRAASVFKIYLFTLFSFLPQFCQSLSESEHFLKSRHGPAIVSRRLQEDKRRLWREEVRAHTPGPQPPGPQPDLGDISLHLYLYI